MLEATGGAVNRLPPPPPPRKYVSLFRIDGVPILPPLMTSEKRRQMQKLKEKALKVEANIEERRSRRLKFRNNIEDTRQSGGNCSGSSDGSMSQQSFEFDTDRLKREQELHENYLMLSDLMQRREEALDNAIDVGAVASTSTIADDLTSLVQSSESNLAERMQKLAKSETIIYDNRANTIIMPMTANDYQRQLQQQQQQQQQQQHQQQHTDKQYTPDEQANLNLSHKSMHLSIKQIPSIYVDPPTPVVDMRSFCNSPPNEDAKVRYAGAMYSDEISSDESFIAAQQDSKTMSQSPRSERHALQPDVKLPQRSATSPQLNQLIEQSPPNAVELTPQNTHSENPLVRSNSFTLACPSKALLEHIRKQKAVCVQQRRTAFSASATRDTVESKAKRVQKADLKTRSPPMRSGQRKSNANSHSNCGISHTSANSLHFRSKRSPYDSKGATKPKLARPLKKSMSAALVSTNNIGSNNNNSQITSKTIKTRTNSTSPQSVVKKGSNTTVILSQSLQQHEVEDGENGELLFTQFEAEHRQKLLQLIAQQQEEQKRLQAAFEAQQQELFAQLSAGMNKMHLPGNHSRQQQTYDLEIETSPNSKSECSEFKSPTASVTSSTAHTTAISNNTFTGADLPSLDLSITPTSTATTTNRCTPRRRLFIHEDLPPPSQVPSAPSSSLASLRQENASGAGTMMPPPSSRCHQRRLEAAAATVINAHARGFLVRRLFQTEQIQRIVQTIRDTLIFVLNLHMETLQNPNETNTPANIKLKARLLQQLSSATRTLHLVFFQTTVKERMEIIARDRKRIKTKLMAMTLKRSPRITA